MPLDTARARQLLNAGDLRTLFIEELGWDRHKSTLRVQGRQTPAVVLQALAEKRGMVAYHCASAPDQSLPSYTERRRIEHQVSRAVHEHLIVFTDATNGKQIWQWLSREPGKPPVCREHVYHRGQPGDALIQKLENIAFSLQEEESLTLPEVTRRARAGFDVDRVTKRFYERFQQEHAKFLQFVEGITSRTDREWYASVMLNRLMFVYFIQRKGFLDGDRDYLRNRLNRLRAEHGRDRFFSFYRYFLLRLFHEGLGSVRRSPELERLVGRIPYLNGGLFDIHELERPNRYGNTLQIPDQAFEGIFDYFDRYHWHLDESPLRSDNEINPDVLGYIFEKYINQKQMGAYYTKEDITEYITRSTVIPFLLSAVREKCGIAFDSASHTTVWDLLKENPDRYVFPAVRHGITWDIHADGGRGVAIDPARTLPGEIALGLNLATAPGPREHSVGTLNLRKGWNEPAPAEFGLATESWRDVVTRRGRYEEIISELAKGRIQDIESLITLNLDTRLFAQDLIESWEGPEILRAFWHALQHLTILDPTCGSGAFLFAALNILEPLYDACLERMEAFVQEGADGHGNRYSDFRSVLAGVGKHPNRRYFILKRIILNNLYGVDIMEEAVEICKLRLFLKLAAQVSPHSERANLGVEPLPDIDFNIRPGNTLVGYATHEAAKQAVASQFDFGDSLSAINARAADLQRAFDAFRAGQVEGDPSLLTRQKESLTEKSQALDTELNQYLATEYGVYASQPNVYASWLKTHEPFHWLVHFYGIMSQGGFDVIIGNPPYVELSDIVEQYSIRGLALTETGNLYAVCVERFAELLHPRGRLGVIVPISAASTPRMLPLMRLLSNRFSLLQLSHFAVRPSKLFVGVDMNLTIVVAQRAVTSTTSRIFSTAYNRWAEAARPYLFALLAYAPSTLLESARSIPKLGSTLAEDLLECIGKQKGFSRLRLEATGSDRVFYHSGGRYFRKCIRDQLSNEYKELRVQKGAGDAVICLLSSSLYYWFWIAISDCYHVTKRDIDALPVPTSLMTDERMHSLAEELLTDLWKHAEKRTRNRADGTRREEVNFRVGQSKPLLDEIDTILAGHYGLTDEQLDYILNYDVRYRLANDSD